MKGGGTLDLSKVNTHIMLDLYEQTDNTIISANRGDQHSRTVVFSFVYDGNVYDLPEGATARIMGHRPDGSAIFEDCIVDGNQVIYEITPYVLNVSGDVHAKISLTDITGEQVLTTISFTIHIPPDPFDENAVIDTDEFSALTELIKEVQTGLVKLDEGLTKLDEGLTELNDGLDRVDETTKVVNDLKEENTALNKELKDTISEAEGTIDAANGKISEMTELQSDMETLKTETETAKANAITATEAANKATESADKATTNANDATTRANDAAQAVEDLILSLPDEVGTGGLRQFDLHSSLPSVGNATLVYMIKKDAEDVNGLYYWEANSSSYVKIDTGVLDAGTLIVDLTWAEYQALTDEDKNNGIVYNVTDEEDWLTEYLKDYHSHTNKELLDGITQDTIEKWNKEIAIEDNLSSSHSDTALSSRQGKILKETIDALGSDVADKVTRSTILSLTLPSAGWSGSAAPYGNTISVPGATEDNIIEVTVPNNVTANQVAAYQAAQFCGGVQATDSITLHAWGEIPSIDLPIIIIVRGDI